MANIVGEKFKDYVKGQIDKRQEINNLANSHNGVKNLYLNNANTAFLKLSSGVNFVTNPDLKNFSSSDKEAKNYSLFNTMFGGEMAKGVQIGPYNSAYGFQSNSDYGFVPPPGLVSADIKSLNRGSLREATINILCHSIDQFEIIEQLYLRLGFSMLLEWGWSYYIDNKGNYQTSYHSSTMADKFFTSGMGQIEILNNIEAQRRNSDGNYDAMLGLVKNYSWDLQNDGSYSITLTLVSVGDVIESFKSNVAFPTQTATTTTGSQDQPPLQYNAQKYALNKILWWMSTQLPPGDMINSNYKYYLTGEEITAGKIANGTSLKYTQQNDDIKEGMAVIGFLFPQLLGVKASNVKLQAQYFIKLGFLLRCIQNFCLMYDPKTKDAQALINLDFDENSNFCFTYPRHGSLDPRVCVVDIPKEVPSNSNTQTYTGTVTKYVWNSIQLSINGVSQELLLEPNKDTGEKFSAQDALSALLWDYFPGLYNGRKVVDPNKDPIVALNEAKNILNQIDQAYTSNVFPNGANQAISGNPTQQNNTSTTVYTNPNVDLVVKAREFTTRINGWYDEFRLPLDSATAQTLDLAIGDEYITNINTATPIELFTLTFPAWRLSDNVKEEYTLKILQRSIETVKWMDANMGYQEEDNVPPPNDPEDPQPQDVRNFLFNRIRDNSKFRYGNEDEYKFIGRTMNIYVNMDYIVKTLDKFIDITSGTISLYDFLDNLMKGIQHAMGNVNNFNITYDEEKNKFYIMDSTFIPGLGNTPEGSQALSDSPAEFITHTLDRNKGSFMRNASVKTQLSNNFATQVTVGAQANGNVVGENATALSRWNNGLVDRIISEKTNANNPQAVDPSNISEKFYSNVGLVQQLYSAINDGNITDQQIDGTKDAGIDLFKYEIGTYVSGGLIPSIGFLPINLELTMDGLSGMKIYQTYTADTRLLPSRYRNAIQFITTGISHKIQNNDWTTTIQSISGPKYGAGTKVGKIPSIKTHTLKQVTQTSNNNNNRGAAPDFSVQQASPTNPKGYFIRNGGINIDSAYKLRAHHSEMSNWEADSTNIRSGGWSRTQGSKTKGVAAYVYDVTLSNQNNLTKGLPIPSPVNGTIKQKVTTGDSILTIEDSNGKWHRLLHMDNFTVNVGDTVTKGQILGKQSDVMTGNGGFAKNVHLHMEFTDKQILINYINDLFNGNF